MELARFVQNCGWEFNPRKRKALKRTSFAQFMAKSARDSLTFDAAPIETEFKRNRGRGLDGFYAPDGSTIRLCTEEGYQGDDQITALQVVQGRIATAFTSDSLVYEVRNPRTDVRLAGYGLGETELIIKTVTGLLNALAYNNAGFDQNSIPRGMLNLVGSYGKEDLAGFKRGWNNMVRGVNNHWALPVMVSPDEGSKATFTKFGADYDEMLFSKWITLLVSIICATYGMSPEEISFESFAAQKSAMSGNDTEEKITNAHNNGFHPNLAFYEATISDYLISEFDEGRFCFRWTGTKPEDEAWKREAKKLSLTVDELRAEEGNKPFPIPGVGALPINPSLIGPAMQLSGAGKEGGDFGGGPAPPGGADFGGAAPQPGPDYGEEEEEEGGDDAGGGESDNGGSTPPEAAGGSDFGGGPDAAAGGKAGAGRDFGKAFTIYKVGG